MPRPRAACFIYCFVGRTKAAAQPSGALQTHPAGGGENKPGSSPRPAERWELGNFKGTYFSSELGTWTPVHFIAGFPREREREHTYKDTPGRTHTHTHKHRHIYIYADTQGYAHMGTYI